MGDATRESTETTPRFLGLRLEELLDEFASEARAPGSGSGAAIVAALAAGLVVKCARLSRPGWSGAGGAVAQADALRSRTVLLAEADAVVYEEALATLRGAERISAKGRDEDIRDALGRAAEILLLISHAACDVALLAADVAEAGNPELSADAGVAALLAETAARSARHLVAVNLATVEDDLRVAQADALVTTAGAAAKRALAGAR